MKFQINSVGILAPALPGLIAAFFLLRHLHAAFDQCVAQCINVLHFKAEMLYPLAANFRSRIGLENFNVSRRNSIIGFSEPISYFCL
jgi:hypothetical protein